MGLGLPVKRAHSPKMEGSLVVSDAGHIRGLTDLTFDTLNLKGHDDVSYRGCADYPRSKSDVVAQVK